jgi:hypothetical protein
MTTLSELSQVCQQVLTQIGSPVHNHNIPFSSALFEFKARFATYAQAPTPPAASVKQATGGYAIVKSTIWCTEVFTLDRLLYRFRNQLRNSKILQHLHDVRRQCRILEHYWNIDQLLVAYAHTLLPTNTTNRCVCVCAHMRACGLYYYV